MTLEFHLLCRCSRTSLDAGAAALIRQLLHEPVDFAELIRLAQRHGVVPLLAQTLVQTGAGLVPVAVLAQLQAQAALNHALNRALAAELTSLLALLDSQAIPALPFKGPRLALTAYGSLALRKAGDLDLLVRGDDAHRAAAMLQSVGYTLKDSQEHELRLEHTARHIIVELSSRIAPPQFLHPLEFDFFWPHRITRLWNGSSLPGLPPEHDLLLLCVHGARHYWPRLMWICDIAELLRAYPHHDWNRLRQIASEAGLWKAVGLGLKLAHDMLGAEMPDRMRHSVDASRTVRRIATTVESHISAPATAAPYLDHVRLRTFNLELLDSLPHRCWRRLVLLCRKIPPTERDIRLMPLSPRYRFLHYLVRPLRLLAEYGALPAARRLRRFLGAHLRAARMSSM